MPGFSPNRRDALKRMAVLGAAEVLPGLMPIRSARAADLTAGFVYIGPRLDWGWNQSHEVAAAGLRRSPQREGDRGGFPPGEHRLREWKGDLPKPGPTRRQLRA